MYAADRAGVMEGTEMGAEEEALCEERSDMRRSGEHCCDLRHSEDSTGKGFKETGKFLKVNNKNSVPAARRQNLPGVRLK